MDLQIFPFRLLGSWWLRSPWVPRRPWISSIFGGARSAFWPASGSSSFGLLARIFNHGLIFILGTCCNKFQWKAVLDNSEHIPVSGRSGKVAQSRASLTGVPHSLRFILNQCNGRGPLRRGLWISLRETWPASTRLNSCCKMECPHICGGHVWSIKTKRILVRSVSVTCTK